MKKETKKQKQETAVCPRCKKKRMVVVFPAISKRDEKTKICSECGVAEAIFDFTMQRKKDAERAWLLK